MLSQIGETESYLIKVGLCQLGVHLPVLGDVGVHVLLKIHRQELKDEVQLGLLHQHILPLMKSYKVTTR